MKHNNKELLYKSLLYRSCNRGCKETDILLGKFAQENLKNFADSQLELYKNFIAEDDLLIYDWLLRKVPTPDQYQTLVGDIRQFHKL